MKYLHSRKPSIVHRDLKSKNILLNKDLVPKICDFGISKYLTDSLSLHTKVVGTFEYIAPECIFTYL
jgi:serine/threonine protein kinase